MADAKFKVSSALKNIIGSELITDDFIAVFELVKNSFDAHAENVVVRFDNLRDEENATITISDDGKGMTAEDLRDKWLWVAYSAKRDHSEDAALSRHADYRDLIGLDRPFAGAKGIGRFSCDRLGQFLLVYSRRDPKIQRFDWLKVDWKEFEQNDKQRFEEVSVKQGISKKDRSFGLKRGTVLKISKLRSEWTRTKLLDLRAELQKLINPDSESKGRRFRIVISAPDEATEDEGETDTRKRVNGEVSNFLFERLKIKTTQITCEVLNCGKTISTALYDRGTLIYRLVEHNTAYQELRDVRISLFYLNRSAKLSFRKMMGMQPVQFGSVFLYKNGFRVQPYGREGDDGFELDRRKQQGTGHYLGTRDLLGRIEIQDENTRFKEVSSRDGGLINSPERVDLLEFFKAIALRRLEAYVVDVIKWGQPPKGSDSEGDVVSPQEVRSEIIELVKKLTDTTNAIRFESDPDVLRIVTERQAEGASGLLANLERMADDKSNRGLAKEARRIRREMNRALQSRAAAQQAMQRERKIRVLQEKQLDVERDRNVFLTSLVSPAEEQKDILHHWAKVVGEDIRGTAEKLMAQVRRGKVDAEEIAAGLADIIRDSSKLATVSELVAHGGFGVKKTKIPGDIARFAFEYLSQTALSAGIIRHKIAYDSERGSQCRFQPVEITMLIDNIISNAKKAGAKMMEWQIETEPKQVRITVTNDGKPLNERIESSLFELGATGTRGTGIGLYTCKWIMRNSGGDIKYIGNDKTLGGARFEMTFPL